MLGHFMNEIINAVLQLCKYFHLSQNVQVNVHTNECAKTFI